MKLFYPILFSGILFFSHCDKRLQEPITTGVSHIDNLADCEHLQNDYTQMGAQFISPELSSDNLSVPDSNWAGLSVLDRNIYTWEKVLYTNGLSSTEYVTAYKQVHVSNEVLEALPLLPVIAGQEARRHQVEGAALFYRAQAFFNVLQLFAQPYNASTARSVAGIMLKLTPDFHVRYFRSSLEDSYRQVIDDLQQAALKLRPLPAVDNKRIPSKLAAQALLARVYLSMRNYAAAFLYADSCLQRYPYLLDYNGCTPGAERPFTASNPEIILQAYLPTQSKLLSGIRSGYAVVDSNLYALYASNDLRPQLYYTLRSGKAYLSTSYSTQLYCFGGLATDELYLIRAECAARLGHSAIARDDLNLLLQNRYRRDTYQPVQLTDTTVASLLEQIWQERRKELAFRGLRWGDLRRLHQEQAGPSLWRRVNGVSYELAYNSNRYTFPLPDDVLANTDMEQNLR